MIRAFGLGLLQVLAQGGASPGSGLVFGVQRKFGAGMVAFQELTVIAVPPLDAGQTVAPVVPRLHRESGVRFVLSGTLRRTAAAVSLLFFMGCF